MVKWEQHFKVILTNLFRFQRIIFWEKLLSDLKHVKLDKGIAWHVCTCQLQTPMVHKPQENSLLLSPDQTLDEAISWSGNGMNDGSLMRSPFCRMSKALSPKFCIEFFGDDHCSVSTPALSTILAWSGNDGGLMCWSGDLMDRMELDMLELLCLIGRLVWTVLQIHRNSKAPGKEF
jgi:hypothetical protein